MNRRELFQSAAALFFGVSGGGMASPGGKGHEWVKKRVFHKDLDSELLRGMSIGTVTYKHYEFVAFDELTPAPTGYEYLLNKFNGGA
jgi:hypothetical protein